MSRQGPMTVGEFKVYTRSLVQAFGGIEAVAAEFKISAERVSQYYRQDHAALMPAVRVFHLEFILKRLVVTAAQAHIVECGSSPEIMDAAVEVCGAATDLLRDLNSARRRGALDAGSIRKLQQEAEQVRGDADSLVEAASRLISGDVG